MTTAPPLVDAGTGFRIVPARALLPELPADLSAILFHERAPVGHTVRVCAVGDSGLSGQVGRTASELGYGALLREVAPLLQSAAAAFANLEGTLIERPRDALFAAPPAAAEALRQAGVTIVHLANNHVYDFGPTGLASTLAAAAGANLVALGAGDDAAASRRLVRTECRGVRVGWLGCGRTLLPQDTGARFWEFDEQELLSAIRKARPSVDVLIASVHIGYGAGAERGRGVRVRPRPVRGRASRGGPDTERRGLPRAVGRRRPRGRDSRSVATDQPAVGRELRPGVLAPAIRAQHQTRTADAALLHRARRVGQRVADVHQGPAAPPPHAGPLGARELATSGAEGFPCAGELIPAARPRRSASCCCGCCSRAQLRRSVRPPTSGIPCCRWPAGTPSCSAPPLPSSAWGSTVRSGLSRASPSSASGRKRWSRGFSA
ncbi:MAG: hypothetical protein DMD56_12995 [Gemmatimonadetes bacterium]|nr:MAG: hypothetical protein DMD56_12995 [Gemmatimonadota bacterium]